MSSTDLRHLHAGGNRVGGGLAGATAEHAALGPRRGEAGVRAAGADAGTLEEEGGLGDGPAVALPSDEVGGVADRVVEEDLVEHGVAGHLPQGPDGDAGLVEGEREPGDAGVLRDREVGAGEEHAVVGLHRHGAPDLLAVDDPAVAVALGPGGEPGQVGAGAGLAEQLAPVVLPVEDRGHEPGDLVGRAVGEDRRRRHEQAEPAGRAQGPELAEGGAHGVHRCSGEAATALLGGQVGERSSRRRPRGATSRRRRGRGPSGHRARRGPPAGGPRWTRRAPPPPQPAFGPSRPRALSRMIRADLGVVEARGAPSRSRWARRGPRRGASRSRRGPCRRRGARPARDVLLVVGRHPDVAADRVEGSSANSHGVWLACFLQPLDQQAPPSRSRSRCWRPAASGWR